MRLIERAGLIKDEVSRSARFTLVIPQMSVAPGVIRYPDYETDGSAIVYFPLAITDAHKYWPHAVYKCPLK